MEIAAINIKYTITLAPSHLRKGTNRILLIFLNWKNKKKDVFVVNAMRNCLAGTNSAWDKLLLRSLHQKEIYLKQVVESGTIKTPNIEIQNILGKTSCNCNCQMQR